MPSDLSSTDLEEESIAQQVSKLNLNQHSIDARSFGQVPMVMEMKDLYPLDKPEHIHQLAFFKRSTQIQDPIQLKQHIMGVAEEAFQVFPYPCIYGQSQSNSNSNSKKKKKSILSFLRFLV